MCVRARARVYVCMYMSAYANELESCGYICFILQVQLICASLLLLLQIGFSGSCIMSSCVKPIRQQETNPVVLLHCFDRF